MNGLARTIRGGLLHALVMATLGVLGFFLFQDPRAEHRYFHADILAPVQMLWDLRHGPGPAEFQLNRIPSLWPDIALYAPLEMLLGDFRYALLAFGILQAATLIYGAAWWIAEITGRSLAAGAAAMGTLVVLACLIGQYNAHQLFALVMHSGPAVFAVGLGAYFFGALERPTHAKIIVIALMSFATLLSNLLFFLEFILPATLATAFLVWRGVCAWRTAAKLLVPIWVGVLAEPLVQALLDVAPQRMGGNVLGNMGKALSNYPAMLAKNYGITAITIAAPLIALVAQRFALARLPEGRPHRALIFMLIFGVSGMIGSLLFFAASFGGGEGPIRYLASLHYWLLSFAALAVVQVLGGLSAWLAVPAFAAAAVALVTAAPTVPLASWQPPIAVCVARNAVPWGLRAGLSEYWLARPATIGTDYRFQVDPVTWEGDLHYWLNNPHWFVRSIASPAAPPPYNFIVTHRLNEAQLIRKYGAPDRREACGKFVFWIYADEAKLYRNLIDNAPERVRQLAVEQGHYSPGAHP